MLISYDLDGFNRATSLKNEDKFLWNTTDHSVLATGQWGEGKGPVILG